jgi:metallo-beta-lactamase family protein
MNAEIRGDFKGGNPFVFPFLHASHAKRDSMDALYAPGPKVVIAGSGMMTGGRVLSHAAELLPLASTRLLIVGYQGEGTLGRKIVMGEKDVKIAGKPIHIEATIRETKTMSSHADQSQLMNWLSHIQGVKKLFLTHGEDGPRQALAEKIKADIHIEDIQMPTLNQEISF